jgi:AhpD family alkylhydroperoxidase
MRRVFSQIRRVSMMKTNLPLDADRLWADMMALAELTDLTRPYTRRSFTALFLEGRAWLARRFAEAGLTTRIDTAGNLIGRPEGGNPALGVIAVAQINGCDYSLSAHTYLGLNLAKIDAAEIALNRRGASSDAKAKAAVAFAAKVRQARGVVGDADLQAVKAAGFTDAQIVEIIAVVAENVFTNPVNIVAQTDIDFPVVHASEVA